LTISTADIKELRQKSGAGVMECKNALMETAGKMDEAYAMLKQRGLTKAEKRAGRLTGQGLITAYLHHSGNIGAMVEVNCETDFVARTDEFKELARNLAMQVAATAPHCVSPEDNTSGENTDPQMCLLLQPFIKDASKTIQDIIMETSATTGETIKIRRFVRFELGE
jgi:elongation factor Ts